MSKWIWGLLLFLMTGCNAVEAAMPPYVDLSQREAVPVVAQTDIVPLRIAIAAIISPQGTAESYTELADYLADKLERPVKLVQRRTYAEVNELVATGAVDLAFVCTSAYLDGADQFGMELLVAPEINGQTVYHSVLIVPATSTTQSIAELHNKVFAFTDPISFSGRVYPTYLLLAIDTTPERFFQRIFFTYSHDRAIEAVAAGVADGAAVDSLVLDYALQRNPALAKQIKVIHRSPPFGIPPVVIPPTLSPRLKIQLQEILLSMAQDPVGQTILAHLGVDRFTMIADQAYASVRELVREVAQRQ